MDSSLVQADASNDSVVNRESLKRYMKRSYQELETRLEGQPSEEPGPGAVNQRYISTTDPEASVVRQGGGKPKENTEKAAETVVADSKSGTWKTSCIAMILKWLPLFRILMDKIFRESRFRNT